jgi:hypothetical protein
MIQSMLYFIKFKSLGGMFVHTLFNDRVHGSFSLFLFANLEIR